MHSITKHHGGLCADNLIHFDRRYMPMKTFSEAITMWLYCIFPYVVFQWFSPSCAYMKLPASRIARLRIPLPAEALIARGQTLITLKINPSNGHDYADTRDPCFYTNTPSESKRIRCLDASEACDDPGNASSRRRATVYMSRRLRGCLVQHHRIDLGQKVVDESLPVSRQCHGVCHTLISAHTAAVGPHGNSQDSRVS